MQSFGIGELSRQTGVPSSTIRYYERIKLLPPCRRVNGKRRYDPSSVRKLSIIRVSQQAGFSIADIQALLHDFPADTPPSERWRTLAGKKLVELDHLIQRIGEMQSLLRKTLHCTCATLEECAVPENGQNGEAAFRLHCGISRDIVPLSEIAGLN